MNWKSKQPPVLVGEKVSWIQQGQNYSGTVRWIGTLPEINSTWSVGLELDRPVTNDSNCDGFWQGRKLFECQPKHGLIVPIEEIEKTSVAQKERKCGTEYFSGQNLADSQTEECLKSNTEDSTVEKSPEITLKTRHSVLESKLNEWGFKNRKCGTKADDNSDKTIEGWKKKCERASDGLKRCRIKSKLQDGKLSLKKGKKRKSFHEYQYRHPPSRKFEEDLQLVRKSLDKCSYFTINQAFEPPGSTNGKMNDVAGYFKQIKEEDILDNAAYKPSNECDKQLGSLLDMEIQGTEGTSKEKKFFSFLKWFKKNKENPTLKNIKDSSVASSPVFQRRRDSSCESIDTLFSTQTVRSFAYIPPQQYQPSAPPSCLLDFEKDDNIFNEPRCAKKSQNAEPLYDKKKKRRAPGPPRLTRENSLPTTLEHKKKDEQLDDGIQTFHRRTLSESFKDKKAGAYCHVQGKRKAPLPPLNASTIYPNLQKINNPYQSMQKKKKPAPPPPQPKSDKARLNQEPAETPKVNENLSEPEKLTDSKPIITVKSEIDDQSVKVSLSPIPSRPWYKRSHRDSGFDIIKKDLLKGFERKKSNKEVDDWMPEVGFSRRSLQGDGHGKFNVFARLDKYEDKKKEERRKSQISILTNISELDKEAAEIVRKEQAEEKKILAENDEKYYSPKDFIMEGIKAASEMKNTSYHINPNGLEEDLRKSNGTPSTAKKNSSGTAIEILKNPNSANNSCGPTSISMPDASEKTKPNTSASNLPNKDVTSSPKVHKSNLNHFDVKNKEVYYMNEPWVCGKCTLENAGWRVFCEICSSVKPRFLYNFNGKSPQASGVLGEKAEPTDADNTACEKVESNKQDENQKIKESAEEIRKKRMDFFSTKLAKEENSEAISDLNKPNLKMIPKREIEISNDALQRGTEQHLKVEEPKESSKLKLSEGIQETVGILNDSEKNGVKKKRQSQDVKDKVIEAYVITKTTILEDIIIKKADKKTKVSTAAQTNGNPQVLCVPSTLNKINVEPSTSDQMPKTFQGPIDLSSPLEDLSQDNLRKLRDNLDELAKRLQRAEGLADFKATVKEMAPDTGMNTVAVNRLMKKLEGAINGGDHFVAAGLAKELALMKISCSVTRQTADDQRPMTTPKITVDLYLEDKVSHQGPIKIQVSPSMTLLQLKKRVEQEMGIPVNIQRWILDKRLATDDNKTLESDGIKNNSSSIFLYLVTPGNGEAEFSTPTTLNSTPVSEAHQQKDQVPANQNVKGLYQEKNCIDSGDTENKSNGLPDDDKSTENQIKTGVEGRKTFIGKHPPPETSKSNTSEKQSENPQAIISSLRNEEDSIEKELKLISPNSVRQKVNQLNKSLAQNNKSEKFNLRPVDGWKCLTCTYVNSRGRNICFACSAKKPGHKGTPEAPRVRKPGDTTVAPLGKAVDESNVHYKELMELQDVDLVSNLDTFNCPVCMVDYTPGEGVTLKDCLHTFCRPCLINTVKYSDDAEVKCPYLDKTYSCTSVLQQREIKALVPQKIFEMHLAKSVKEAENKIGNAFHCKTPDCKGWCVYEDNVNVFHCPVCKLPNCLTCHAIHTGINCREYQERMKDASETDEDAMKTRIMLEEMVQKGEAMACPKCQVVLMKKWGCDWLRCSMCKTEICWVTKKCRWGPGGKGDVSGGCKCGVNGVKCHPKCNYCH